jgi:hypothetical protein
VGLLALLLICVAGVVGSSIIYNVLQRTYISRTGPRASAGSAFDAAGNFYLTDGTFATVSKVDKLPNVG